MYSIHFMGIIQIILHIISQITRWHQIICHDSVNPVYSLMCQKLVRDGFAGVLQEYYNWELEICMYKLYQNIFSYRYHIINTTSENVCKINIANESISWNVQDFELQVKKCVDYRSLRAYEHMTYAAKAVSKMNLLCCLWLI